ncbi:hypothetical protein RRG08_013941 [Elysia crispata]|uniref:C2H2-type domain-containing protein n=1 Tax=Elysia crispata TaxID=231223 RepID=A0AAE1DWU7_9GAST|nr:hypothetical protein RRG08_013941 [Elysia crispata]
MAEAQRDESSPTPRKRGRPPKATWSSGRGRSQPSEINVEVMNQTIQKSSLPGAKKPGRPPKSPSLKTEHIEPDQKDFLISLDTKTNKAIISKSLTLSNSADKRSNRIPNSAGNSESETPTSSRRSCGRPKRFEDTNSLVGDIPGHGSEKVSAPKAAGSKVSNSSVTAHKRPGRPAKFSGGGPQSPSNLSSSQSDNQPVPGSKIGSNNQKNMLQTGEVLPSKLNIESPAEPCGTENPDATLLWQNEMPCGKKDSKSSESRPKTSAQDENVHSGKEKMTELLQKVALNNSTQKKRGRPRKQNSEMMLNDASSDKAQKIESGRKNSVSVFEKKGRPGKLAANTLNSLDKEDGSADEVQEGRGDVKNPLPNVRKKGRPRKLTLDTPSGPVKENLSHVKQDSASKEVTPILTGKRKRVQNPKYAEDDSDPEGSDAADTSAPPQIYKKRGRPPKSSSQKEKVNTAKEDSNEEYQVSDFDSDEAKRSKKGRKRKQVVESCESDEEPAPKRKKKGNNQSPKAGKLKEEMVSSKKCVLCKEEFKGVPAIKRHMMTSHSLVYTKENPEGVQNSYLIVRTLGFIDCQRCHKRFKGGQYYKHHSVWCGREEEMAECEICQTMVKAMWLQQHLGAHRMKQKQLDKQKEIEEERARRKLQKEEEDSDPDQDGTAKKTKRKAAKSALKYMSQEQDLAGGDCSDGDSYKDSGNEESESDDGDEGDEEDEESDHRVEETGSRDKKTNLGIKFLPRWNTLFRPTIGKPLRNNLQKLWDFYGKQSQQPLLRSLQPSRENWRPLSFRERMRYLPDPARITSFCTRFKGTENTEDTFKEESSKQQKLSLGQTCTVEGNFICSTGSPVWAIEWCPLPSGMQHCQVLAVAVDSMDAKTDSNRAVSAPGMVQFWSLRDIKQEGTSGCDKVSEPAVSLRCCVAHDAGRIRSMAWCPRTVTEHVKDQEPPSDGYLQRLGILALACSNGTVLMFSIPQLNSLQTDKLEQGMSDPVLVIKPKASLTLELNTRSTYCGPCLCVAWQQGEDSRYIAAGFGSGLVVVWDLQSSSPLMTRNESILRPLRCFLSHGAPVMSLAWCPQLPHLLASSSSDFTLSLTEVNRPGTIHADKRQLHPSIFRSLRWAGPLYLGFFCAEESLSVSNECGVQYVGLSKRSLGRKRDAQFLIHNNTAATWDVDFCPYSLVAATCDANGKVKVLLVDMVKMTTEKGGKISNTYDVMSCPTALVYQTQVDGDKTTAAASISGSKQGVSKVKPEPPPIKVSSSDQNLQAKTNGKSFDIAEESATQLSSEADTLKTLSPVTARCESHIRRETGSQRQQNSTPVHQASAASTNSRKLGSLRDQASVSFSEPQLSVITNGDRTLLNGEKVKDNAGSSNVPDSERTESVGQISTEKSCVSVNVPSSVIEDHSSKNCSKKSRNSLIIDKHHSSSIASITTETSCLKSCSIPKQCQTNSQKEAEPGDATLIREGAKVKEAAESNLRNGAGTIYFESFEKVKFNEAKGAKTVEELANPDNQLVFRVRLNPNPECCAWLASGGQSGLLRLDNLSQLLGDHRPEIKKLHAKTKS